MLKFNFKIHKFFSSPIELFFITNFIVIYYNHVSNIFIITYKISYVC